jgi:hypothetical protein
MHSVMLEPNARIIFKFSSAVTARKEIINCGPVTYLPKFKNCPSPAASQSLCFPHAQNTTTTTITTTTTTITTTKIGQNERPNCLA